jgi:menaquinone-9 beta-reductase
MGFSLVGHLQKMNESATYDVAIIGGGLAGLCLSIQLRQQGYSVIVFEKESYPIHKVCGEYISRESWNFLRSLGLPLQEMQLPIIDRLFLSAPNGTALITKLPLGGFGISRYKLDSELAQIAKSKGVVVKESTKVDAVHFDEEFQVVFGQQNITAKMCCAAYGKRSNLDVKWKRSFLDKHDQRLNNFVGVKYHIQTDWPDDVIGLHNFENGYCGISKIEEDKYCLCYMTRAENLKRSGNDIRQMEEAILHVNPHLKRIFSQSHFLPEFPVTISQISFSTKTPVEDHVLMLGDAAGMITPLCGNGMSIAFHTSKIAANLVALFLKGSINRQQLENLYAQQWKSHFSKRLQTGRTLQKFFGKKSLSNVFVSSFKTFPFLAKPLIRMTHGSPF